MLLGKRARPPMKRTTSMSEITLDLNVPPPDPANSANPNTQREGDAPRKQPARSNCLDRKVLASATIANRTRHSADFLETAESDFLRACSLCKRRLVPSRDIYMYRGDSAFCSQECRQQQMIEDERKEKRCLASSKQVVAQPSGSHQVTTTKGESVAAL